MSGKTAVRNVRLCEKDCLCLYVCPTGATDTENSVIDPEKCIGCGACAEACPSGAISLVPKEYPPQQVKTGDVIAALRQLAGSKTEQEALASALPGPLADAVERSSRIMAEDLLREAGYMLPESPVSRLTRWSCCSPPLSAMNLKRIRRKEPWKNGSAQSADMFMKAPCRRISDARSANSPRRSL